MDLDSALKSVMEFDLRDHCHVNSNEDGDRFVGIKADSDNAMVYFPIGYQLPETDTEIRTDKKIDGAIATIMGLDRAIRCGAANGASVYDERGILFI